MLRFRLSVGLATCVIVAGCGAIAAIAAPKIVSVTITAPAGLLVGESATATAVAMGDDGRDHGGRPRHWSSSDPAALSIDASGKMTALIAGRTVTITCEVDGTKGTATVGIGSDDTRIGYALADQPTAPGPYAPAAGTSFNSSGGAISVTRSSTGTYSISFAGLGRPPGGRDNVQVSGYSETSSPVYCHSGYWNVVGSDMVMPVRCFSNDGTLTDSKFTILLIGARTLGATTPTGFSLVADSTTRAIDSVTVRNSTGGQVQFGYNSAGNYSEIFVGLGAASGGAAGPVGLLISPVGPNPWRCHVFAYDLSAGGLGISCENPFAGFRDSPFSVLWLTRGRPGFRFGFALPMNAGATNAYSPSPELRSSSSGGGSITSRNTGAGKYQVVFGGLARPAGGSEIVLVSAFGMHGFCNVTSWANSGSDLVANVACFDSQGRLNNNNGVFNILVIQ